MAKHDRVQFLAFFDENKKPLIVANSTPREDGIDIFFKTNPSPTAAEGERPRPPICSAMDCYSDARPPSRLCNFHIEQAQADRGSVQTALPRVEELTRQLHRANWERFLTGALPEEEYHKVRLLLYELIANISAPTPLSAEELMPLLKEKGWTNWDAHEIAKDLRSLPGVAVVKKDK